MATSPKRRGSGAQRILKRHEIPSREPELTSEPTHDPDWIDELLRTRNPAVLRIQGPAPA
jgi:hypothetical protein